MNSNYSNQNYQMYYNNNNNNNKNNRQFNAHPTQFQYQNLNQYQIPYQYQYQNQFQNPNNFYDSNHYNNNFYNNQNPSSNAFNNNNIGYNNHPYFNQQLNSMENKLKNICLNNNAKDFVPKGTPNASGSEETGENTNKVKATNLNPNSGVFYPGNIYQNINTEEQTFQNNFNSEFDYDGYNNETQTQIENSDPNFQYEIEPIETFIEGDESDKEIWIPKYQDCECCQGFVYKCKGPACLNMEVCYCKATDECNFN